MHDSYVSFFFDEIPVDFSEIVSIAISNKRTQYVLFSGLNEFAGQIYGIH